MTAQLYRHFDIDDTLLYIGVSLNTMLRLSQHKTASGWFNDVTKVTIETLSSRKKALEAETIAIQSEGPIWNIQKTQPKVMEHLEDELNRSPPEQSSVQLLRKIVLFDPIYTIHEASGLLKISEKKLKEMCKTGEIGSFVFNTGVRKNKFGEEIKYKRWKITGWQIIEYIEHLERESLE